MASDSERLPLEVSSSDEKPQDWDDKKFDGMDPLSDISGSTTRRRSPSQTTQNHLAGDEVPRQRPAAAAKHAVVSASGPTSRLNPASGKRITLSAGLSKPPTRPLASASVRRPAGGGGVTAATAAYIGHKKRPSVSTVDQNSRSDVSASEENSKPTLGKSQATRPGRRKEDFRPSTRTSDSEMSKSLPKIDQIPGLVRLSNSSPIKSTLRTATNSSRPNIIQSVVRSNRPTSSYNRGSTSSSGPDNRKRLSTVSASPGKTQSSSEAPNSGPPLALAPTTAVRPGLGTRKSTLSVTIEQRLREMEVVHQMLRVAMAEDGEENDEAKEEYGRQADESLASLRAKLEGARRIEGIEAGPVSKGATIGVSVEEDSSNETVASISNVTDLTTKLRESQQTVSALNAEVRELQKRIEQTQCMKESDQSFDSKDKTSIESAQENQIALERLRKEFSQKIDNLNHSHACALVEAHARFAEAEIRHNKDLQVSIAKYEEAKRLADSQRLDEATETSNSRTQEYATKVRILESELADEKEKGANTVRRLNSEISSIPSLLNDEKLKLGSVVQSLTRHYTKILNEKEHAISVKDHDILNLHREIRDLQNAQSREVEKTESALLAGRESLETALTPLRTKCHELELNQQSVITTHKVELESKDQEINGLSQVIEELQNQVQKLHETKERDVDTTKLNMIQDHEKVVSDLRRSHCDDAEEASRVHEQELQATREQYENILLASHSSHAKQSEDIQLLFETARKDLDNTNVAHSEAHKEIEFLRAKIISLEAEREELKAARKMLDESFQNVSSENADLKERLEALTVERQEKDKLHLTAIKKIENEHTSEMQSMGLRQAEYLKKMEEQNTCSLQELQKKHDELLASWKKAELEESEYRKKVITEHEHTVEKHAQYLEDLKITHAMAIEESFGEAEEKYSENLRDLEEKHKKESEILRQTLTHAQDQIQVYRTTREDETPSRRIQNLQQEVEDLKNQLMTAEAEIAHTNEEIQRLEAAVAERGRRTPDIEEIERMRHEMIRLTEQHAAEINKIQEHISLESEKREKERKQGAEVRDRLASESERLRNDLLASKAEAEEHQRALQFSISKAQEANRNHTASRQVAERQKHDHRRALEELKAVRAEAKKLKSAKAQSESEVLPADDQELEALQVAADAERAVNEKLREQLREALATAERQAVKLREVECALKVTTAELVEAQTVRPNSGEFSASPAPRPGLRLSRWAVADGADQADENEAGAGEELGSSIEGNMAGIQEQIRQLGDLNDDILEDETRVIRLLSQVSEPAPALSSPRVTSPAVAQADSEEPDEEM